MSNGIYLGIRTPESTRITHIPEDVMEIEALRKKLKENSEARDKKIAQLEAQRKAEIASHQAQVAEMEREKMARIREYENRKAKTTAIVKRAVLCSLVIALFFLLFWMEQCKISVFLMMTAVSLVHLAYYAGTWRLEVYQ